MILKFKYHCDSGLLEAYRSYTLAQNNSLSDTIVITSTAADADRYNYCLEFICYNSKSIPKAQYISPIIKYDGGITFVVPNNLTEFRGHVDMQLTGYDPEDNSIVFKSIAKNCKAFDVEASLGVLERDLNDTPNVFTEVLEQLQQLKNIKQDIIDSALDKFGSQMLEKYTTVKWHKVRFLDRGKIISEGLFADGAKLSEPEYTLPQDCVLIDGWYNPLTKSIWNFEEDRLNCDVDLYLNYASKSVIIINGEVIHLGAYSEVYVPEFYQGYEVKSIAEGISAFSPGGMRIYFGNNMEEITPLLSSKSIMGLYFPDTNNEIVSCNGSLYLLLEGMKCLVYVPNLGETKILTLPDDCLAIANYAVSSRCGITKLIIPNRMVLIQERAICDTLIEEVELPSGLESVSDYAFCNNTQLKSVFLKGDLSDAITDLSFVCTDDNGNVISRPKLYAEPYFYQKYKQKNLAYEIAVVGQDYFDGKYVPKEA